MFEVVFRTRKFFRYNAAMSGSQTGEIRVGPAGWAYEDWKGIVYPDPAPRGWHPVRFLAGLFDTIEVNSTFYRPPHPRHCVGWLDHIKANPRFLFTVKLWKRFTHERETWPGDIERRQVTEGLAPLKDAEKLGAVLMQFPWSFRRTPENRVWLARVVDAFQNFPLALEIRHASWNRPEVYAGLADRNIAFCNIDQPLFAQSLKPGAAVTAPLGYVRLHGRNHDDWFREDAHRNDRYNYLYNTEELRPWIEKIQAIMKKARGIFVITNNHYRGQAVVNALEIQAALGQIPQEMPSQLSGHYPRLLSLKKG